MEYKFAKAIDGGKLIEELRKQFPKAKIVFNKAEVEKNIEKQLTITGLTAEQEAQAEEKINEIVGNNIVYEFEKAVCSKCLTAAILADYPSARISFNCPPQAVSENKKKKIIIDDCNISHGALTYIIESDYSACDCENKKKSADVQISKENKKIVKAMLILMGKTWEEFDAEYKKQ